MKLTEEVIDKIATKYVGLGGVEDYRAFALEIAATKPAAQAVLEGFVLVPEAANADEIVSRLYRRFKEWSKRGFGPDDVTWCEVKADINAMLAAAPLSADAAQAVPTQHRAVIEEAAQVLESAAAHNRSKGRTVLAHSQQDRADRLRLILVAPAAPLSADAAQEQARNDALEEAAHICWEMQARPEFEPEFHDKMLKQAENRIRALKRTPADAPADQATERKAARYDYLVSQYPCNIADALDCGIREIGDEIDECIERYAKLRTPAAGAEGAA